VALNPIIKFTTLFGVLAVELAVANPSVTRPIGVALLLVAMFFVYRSFYGMRISNTGAVAASEKKAAA
jgi:K(+)-stimulated pyrophosphate-energized sodium pump